MLQLSLIILWAVPAAVFVLRGRGATRRWKRLGLAAGPALVAIAGFALWQPGPSTQRRFDRAANGLWLDSRWYTGRAPQSGAPVAAAAADELLETLATAGVRYAYVRAGRIQASGDVEALPGPLFLELQERAPEVVFLPWLSADADDLPLSDSAWRGRFAQSLWRLHEVGVVGVHLNIEPVRDGQPGYCDLLRDIRSRFEGRFLVSQATRRVAPFGLGLPVLGGRFWSRAFYQETMAACDQTVLMGYNTLLDSPKLYAAYMRHQTTLLMDWAAELSEHRILIGIPAYEGLSHLSDPRVENIPHAVAGVGAALEEYPHPPACFEGVSIYAHWLIDASEWKQYQETWQGQPAR